MRDLVVTNVLTLVAAFCVCVPMTAQETQSTAERPAKATVYVYRYKQYVGKGIRPSILCDEKDIARIQSGRMVVLAINPGQHIFRSNDKQSRIELDLKAGQTYYIRIEIATGVLKGHGRLLLVAPEQGTAEVKETKPVDKDMLKDSEFLPQDFVPLQ